MAKKSGLGKGLGALLSEATAETNSTNNISQLPLNQLRPNEGQPRKEFKAADLAELTDSIKQNGVLQPLLVRAKGPKYEIVAGERRYQAAMAAGLKEVPVIIKEITDEDVFKLALIENLQRSDLNSIEEAQGYKKLIDDKDLTQEELAKLVSKSRSTITNTLRLLELPKAIQEFVAEGKLTAGHARALLVVSTKEEQEKLAQKVIDQHLSVRETERLAPLFSVTHDAAVVKREVTPQSYKRAARQLRLALETNVRVRRVRGRNKIEIEFGTEDDLLRILNQISE